jgi:hypothetical protein
LIQGHSYLSDEGIAHRSFKRVEDVSGVECVGVVWVLEKVLEIPAELAHEAKLRTAFDGEFVRGGDGDRSERPVVGETGEEEGRRNRSLDMHNRQRCELSSGSHRRLSLTGVMRMSACKFRYSTREIASLRTRE